jgi:FSR family fosmidomycin resistance protein-like MFS transporter
MLLAGFVGTLAGGRLADHYDRGRIIFISLASISVLAIFIASVGFSHGPLWLMFVLAVAFGVGISLSAGVIVVVGQELLPNRIGMASGVTLGLAVSVGGIGAPLYGLIGDRAGLPMVFAAIGAVALIASAASIALPRLPPSGIETFEESQEAAV